MRNEQTGARVYEGPDAEAVNALMHELVEFLNHPRSGILSPHFCSIEEYLGANHQAYYDVLAQVGRRRRSPRIWPAVT